MSLSAPASGRNEDVELDSDDFEDLGAALDDEGGTRRGVVGSAGTRLMDMRDAVDFAVRWLERTRA